MPDRYAPLTRCALLVLALAFETAGAQPMPTTGELPVNTTTFEHQTSPAVAGLTDGSFVVVWESLVQDGDLGGVYAQRFDGAGMRLGDEFRINATTVGQQDVPAVAALTDGGFVVVWASAPQDGEDADVYARRFDPSGSPLSDDVRANTTTPSDQNVPAVAALDGGGFVVAWASEAQDGDGYGIYAHRFNEAGAPVGNEFRVSTSTDHDQTEPAVAGLSSGGFVVAWTNSDGSLTDVWAQRYDGAGAPAGSAFLVNTYTQNNQAQPSVAGLPGGGFVVAWASLIQDLNGWGAYAQRFSPSGAPEGQEIHVSTGATLNNQWLPAVAGLPEGAFVVVWASNLQDDSAYGVYGRRYDAVGAPDGGEFQVNTYTANSQTDPSVAALAGRGFAVAWESDGQDGGLYGIVARIYDGKLTATEAGPVGLVALRGPVPNPARGGEAHLVLDLAHPARVMLRVYDVLGRLLHARSSTALGAGTSQALALPALPPGAYLYRVDVEAEGGPARTFSGPFVVAR